MLPDSLVTLTVSFGPAVPEVEGELVTFARARVAAVLRDVDLERLTPLAAINLLHSLKARLEE